MKTLNITKGHVAIVDENVYDAVSQYKWQYSCGYAKRLFKVGDKRKTVYLHRYIYDLQKGLKFGKQVDHMNGNKLDCRMENLRLCTASENQYNKCVQKNSKTGIKGVYRYYQYWRGEVRYKGKSFMKTSKDQEVVINWLKTKRKEIHGDFAHD